MGVTAPLPPYADNILVARFRVFLDHLIEWLPPVTMELCNFGLIVAFPALISLTAGVQSDAAVFHMLPRI